jgi:hypothetical protein
VHVLLLVFLITWYNSDIATQTLLEGFRDPGSPAGPFTAGTLDGLRPRVDQTGALLGRSFLRTIQTHDRSARAPARVSK